MHTDRALESYLRYGRSLANSGAAGLRSGRDDLPGRQASRSGSDAEGACVDRSGSHWSVCGSGATSLVQSPSSHPGEPRIGSCWQRGWIPGGIHLEDPRTHCKHGACRRKEDGRWSGTSTGSSAIPSTTHKPQQLATTPTQPRIDGIGVRREAFVRVPVKNLTEPLNYVRESAAIRSVLTRQPVFHSFNS